MKTKLNLLPTQMFCAVALLLGSFFGLAAAAEDPAGPAPAKTPEAIPWSQLGAKAGTHYQGDGMAVVPTPEGARLLCVFQRLEGEATRGGLWLTSTVSNIVNDRFRLVAAEVGRASDLVGTSRCDVSARVRAGGKVAPLHAARTAQRAVPPTTLSTTGHVSIHAQSVRFTRPWLVEEYTVSIDGVRQDFVVLERPAGAGELAVRLAASGAKIKAAAFGARLVLENSGREIAYSRLRVTDATGKELSARMEVIRSAAAPAAPLNTCLTSGTADWEVFDEGVEHDTRSACASMLAVVVNDAEAVYPVRIDPTFTDANWISMNPGPTGADSTVNAAVVDGSGNLYIGGDFTVIGEVLANHIAKWDGSSWSALDWGINGSVYALAVSGSDVYAGGTFTMAGGSSATNIAKWNGSSWTGLGSGITGEVKALAVSGSDLYAGGDFTAAGGNSATNIAIWNTSNWSAVGLGIGGVGSWVNALAVSGGDLYAGGYFTTAGGATANYIAKWNGSNWSALGTGMDWVVQALVVSGSDLYAGGIFGTAGGNAAINIAKWNGSSWSALGGGTEHAVYALAVSGSDVYAGGEPPTIPGLTNYMSKWNGKSWSALGSGVSRTVFALAVSGSDVYAGGRLGSAGGSTASGIAKWNGSSWSALNSGTSGAGFGSPVSALAVSGSDLYAGGQFTTAGGSAASYIVKWNGSSWSPLGSGMSGAVSALAVSGGDVYAGGSFTTAGGTAASNIAKWNGSSWSPLGSGINGAVRALAVSGGDVYAGGSFTTAGGTAATNIGKWNGTNWSALGSGLNATVRALAVSGSDVYAGGIFTTAGGSAAHYIAKWNGSSWSALGAGMGDAVEDFYSPAVYTLAVSGGDLYAGGQFTTAGGSPAACIAKWNGSSWSALSSGIGGNLPISEATPNVSALAVSGTDVFAGGLFTTAGGSAAHYIAKWDGVSWTPLGSGMGGLLPEVRALAVSGSDLYAGGDFKTAGEKVSPYIARAYLLNLPTLSVLRAGTNVMVSWPSVDTAEFALEQAGELAAPASWVTNSASVTDDGISKSVSLPAMNSALFFRLRRL